jgi:AcrR family transcriptional regulator
MSYITNMKQDVLTANAEQRRALSSPIRLEILGHFTTPEGMSIADIAERMGRSPGSLYYHFGVLEDVGLIKRIGTRPGVKRDEALFEPAASRLQFPVEKDSEASVRQVMKTMVSAFRMTERDLESAIRTGTARQTGKHRNFFATRMHCRINKRTLADINQHLRAIEQIIEREGRRKQLPEDANQYCSLTLALLPLRGREQD